MKKALTKNWGLKLLAFVFSVPAHSPAIKAYPHPVIHTYNSFHTTKLLPRNSGQYPKFSTQIHILLPL